MRIYPPLKSTTSRPWRQTTPVTLPEHKHRCIRHVDYYELIRSCELDWNIVYFQSNELNEPAYAGPGKHWWRRYACISRYFHSINYTVWIHVNEIRRRPSAVVSTLASCSKLDLIPSINFQRQAERVSNAACRMRTVTVIAKRCQIVIGCFESVLHPVTAMLERYSCW